MSLPQKIASALATLVCQPPTRSGTTQRNLLAAVDNYELVLIRIHHEAKNGHRYDIYGYNLDEVVAETVVTEAFTPTAPPVEESKPPLRVVRPRFEKVDLNTLVAPDPTPEQAAEMIELDLLRDEIDISFDDAWNIVAAGMYQGDIDRTLRACRAATTPNGTWKSARLYILHQGAEFRKRYSA